MVALGGAAISYERGTCNPAHLLVLTAPRTTLQVLVTEENLC